MQEINKFTPLEQSEWQHCLATNWFIADFVRNAVMEREARDALERDNVRIDEEEWAAYLASPCGARTPPAGTNTPSTAFANYFNATIVDVARFFAEQGLTITDIEDIVFCTANWIHPYAPSNSDVIFAANALRASFTSRVRLPLGYNEDYWVPGPAQVIYAHIHNTASNAASTSNMGTSAPPTITTTTTSSASTATPAVATNSAGAAPSAAAPATTIATSSEAASTSAEAIQHMDET
ncbi:hypothetical protein BDP27DRAFT_1435759 [Rhodocollybia butyracea]|uniref:Uncharacterized protein n=1 Tax=Rhodocollybia butyracea TaxID=206335 RepID=A0A9P5TWF6_9AGAR|nr:hypothetical protein BDP27DRAFT_1435759 [Rhodocollybia butyracea]